MNKETSQQSISPLRRKLLKTAVEISKSDPRKAWSIKKWLVSILTWFNHRIVSNIFVSNWAMDCNIRSTICNYFNEEDDEEKNLLLKTIKIRIAKIIKNRNHYQVYQLMDDFPYPTASEEINEELKRLIKSSGYFLECHLISNVAKNNIDKLALLIDVLWDQIGSNFWSRYLSELPLTDRNEWKLRDWIVYNKLVDRMVATSGLNQTLLDLDESDNKTWRKENNLRKTSNWSWWKINC